MNPREELAALRTQIDAVDEVLVAKFLHRMDISERIGDIKAQGNLSLTDEGREQAVLDAAMARAGKDNQAEVSGFMRSLIALSKIKQRAKHMPAADIYYPPSAVKKTESVRVVYQGVSGAWGEQGARKLFPDVQPQPLEYFEDVFEAVKEGRADYGVLPIENSRTGAIGEVYDLLWRQGCFVVGQAWLPITQCLLAKKGSRLTDIREVLSHPQGFAQCRRYLKDTNWILTACRNTAVAAQMISQREDPHGAAIGSRLAAENFGLEVLAPDIMDYPDNQSRFIVIAAQPIYTEQGDTVCVTFSTLNKSGALCTVLQGFMLAGINLTRIESRPSHTTERYRFFVDLQANILREETRQALKEASVQCEYFEVLGCYPANGVC